MSELQNPERLSAYVYRDEHGEGIYADKNATVARMVCAGTVGEVSTVAEYVLADVSAAAVETERQRTWAGTVGEGKKMLDEARAINAALRAEVEALRGRIEAMRGLLESARRTGFDAADSGGRASAYRTMCNALVRDDVAAAKGVG